jgi:hypothetical protein
VEKWLYANEAPMRVFEDCSRVSNTSWADDESRIEEQLILSCVKPELKYR